MAAPQKHVDSSKKRACVECRQQKMRCANGSEEQETPCSRCRRLNISCVYSAPFQRVHKRKRMQELEEETSVLRRELQVTTSPVLSQVPSTRVSEPTEARSIDGLDLSPAIIDKCFKLFFHDYHPLLPVLHPADTPNVLYGKSPVLFWVVVSIGCRKLSIFPSLISALSPRVFSLILSSLNARFKPLESIKALLLLLEWPFPSTSYNCDPSFVLSGALIHMAMQSGLHTPCLSMEALKLDIRSSFVDSTAVERAQLWAYVVIIYQRACTRSGHPTLWPIDTYTEQEQFKSILQQFPSELQLQLQLANIMARAQRTFVQFGLPKLSLQQERTLDSVLQMLAGQLDAVEPSALLDWEKFYVANCRLEVAAMHFFKSSETLNIQICQFIFNTTIEVFEFIRDQEKRHKLSSFCPRIVIFAATMGQALMLRILKGPFVDYVDQERGSELFNATVRFMKSVSIEHGDKPNKVGTITEQMWSSNKMFKDNDGGFSLALRVKNRLSASVIHDVGVRWREEFLGLDRQTDFQLRTASVPPAHTSGLSNPIDDNIGQDIFTAALSTEAPIMPMYGQLGDFGFDLDDIWCRTFDFQ